MVCAVPHFLPSRLSHVLLYTTFSNLWFSFFYFFLIIVCETELLAELVLLRVLRILETIYHGVGTTEVLLHALTHTPRRATLYSRVFLYYKSTSEPL